MKAYSLLAVVVLVSLIGCSCVTPMHIRLMPTYVDLNPSWEANEEDAIGKVIAGKAEDLSKYQRSDWEVRDRTTLLVGPTSKGKHHIVQHLATERGVSEAEREDIVITAFQIAGQPVVYQVRDVPAKGLGRDRFYVYQLNALGKYLVVSEGSDTACGGKIGFLLWDPRTGKIRELWGCAGDEEGATLAHELIAKPKGIEIIIHGVRDSKRERMHADVAALSREIGAVVKLAPGY